MLLRSQDYFGAAGNRFRCDPPSPVRLAPVYDRLHPKHAFVATVLEQDAPVTDAEAPLPFQPLQTENVPNPCFRELIQRRQHSGLRRRVEPPQVPPRPAGKLSVQVRRRTPARSLPE